MRHDLLMRKIFCCLMTTMLLGTSFSQAAWATETDATDSSQDSGLAVQNASDFGGAQNDTLSAQSFDDTADPNSNVRVALVSKRDDSTESLIEELSALSCAEACTPNYCRSLCSFTDPDDPLF